MVQCDKEEEHIAADQIFPLIYHEHFYTPTVKHHCPRVALASSLRACSNKVHFDRNMLAKFRVFFRTTIIPEFMAYMNKELVRVDFETWIKKYPESIKRKLREAIHPDRDRHTVPMVYEAFTKVELQLTHLART